MANIITNKIIRQLSLPKPNSHKRDNGRLLIVAGLEQKYFGALLYSIITASRIADLVYLVTAPENKKLIEKLRVATAEFMPIRTLVSGRATKDIDAILIGPGMGATATTKKLTSIILKSGQKAVLDADALNVLDNKLKKYLSPLNILTPHHREFYRLFHITPTAENASKMAKKYRCTIILKGPADVVASPNGKIALNKTGNAGMTKGGTGDVLAGLIAAIYTTNDAFTSAAAGVYLNGAAGDDLHKKVGTFYNAEDLANQIPHTLHQLIKKSHIS